MTKTIRPGGTEKNARALGVWVLNSALHFLAV
jgi:hypothetical protein